MGMFGENEYGGSMPDINRLPLGGSVPEGLLRWAVEMKGLLPCG